MNKRNKSKPLFVIDRLEKTVSNHQFTILFCFLYFLVLRKYMHLRIEQGGGGEGEGRELGVKFAMAVF